MSKWKAEGRYFDYGKEWWIVDELGHNVLGPIRCPQECFGPETLYQIVSEHNAHEALVGVLKSLRDAPYGLKLLPKLSEHACAGTIRDTWLPKIDAVLAQAEGRE